MRLNDGCIIGYNVKVDDNMDLDRKTKISASPLKSTISRMYDNDNGEKFEEDSDNYLLAVSVVGEKGVGYIYESEVSDDEDSSTEAYREVNSLSNQLDEFYLSDTSISSATKKTKKKRTMSVNSVYTDREEFDSEFEEEDFEKEGIATVERAMENNHDLDTALLELNTLRMSMNVTYHEVRIATITALLKRVYHFIATQTLGPKDAVAKVFNQWGLLFKRQVFDEEEYVDLMNILMEKIVEQNFDKPDLILFSALVSLYDNDIIEEDSIYRWWDSVSVDPCYDEVKKLTVKWVEWLQNADEESSEEE